MENNENKFQEPLPKQKIWSIFDNFLEKSNMDENKAKKIKYIFYDNIDDGLLFWDSGLYKSPNQRIEGIKEIISKMILDFRMNCEENEKDESVKFLLDFIERSPELYANLKKIEAIPSFKEIQKADIDLKKMKSLKTENDDLLEEVGKNITEINNIMLQEKDSPYKEIFNKIVKRTKENMQQQIEKIIGKEITI